MRPGRGRAPEPEPGAPRVLYLTNIPSPYRVAFFNELGKYCDLTVVYERDRARNRHSAWVAERALRFEQVYLRGLLMGDDGAFSPGVLRQVIGRRYDLVVVGGYATPTAMIAIASMRLLRRPFILNADGGFVRPESRRLAALKRWAIAGAEAWLSTGRAATSYLKHYGAADAKIHQYPFSSVRESDILSEPVTSQVKASARRHLSIGAGHVVLGVGRIVPEKGYDLLLEAASALGSGVSVYIVGGQPTTELKALQARLGVSNVHFVDFQDEAGLREYFAAADVFVHPARSEVWGLVINEAMANGLPVVATEECGAGLEMVNASNGQLVPREDVNELVRAIRAVLSEAKSGSMASASIRTARAFTVETMAQRHSEILQAIKNAR